MSGFLISTFFLFGFKVNALLASQIEGRRHRQEEVLGRGNPVSLTAGSTVINIYSKSCHVR